MGIGGPRVNPKCGISIQSSAARDRRVIGVGVVQDVHMSIFRDVMHAFADGFGYVIASLVGALVALTFTVPGDFPDIYYIGTIVIALVGAVVIAILHRAIDSTIRVSDCDEGPGDQQFDAVIKRLEEIDRRLKSVQGDAKELRKPWWKRRAG